MDRNRAQAAQRASVTGPSTSGPQTIGRDFDLATRYLQTGFLAEAETLYRHILAFEPGHAEALHHCGLVAWKLGRPHEAAHSIRRALDVRPAYAEALSNLGVVLHSLGEAAEAVAACRRAIDLEPGFAKAHSNLGNGLRAQGLLEEAVAAYRRAVALDPALAEGQANLGDTLLRMGSLEAAAAACREAVALRPDLAEAHQALGHVLRRQDRLPEAVAAYRRAAELAPNSPVCLTDLGNALREQGDFTSAIAAHREALALAPQSAETLCSFGRDLEAQGALDAAGEAYAEALALAPHLADAHCGLGRLAGATERWEEAVPAYRRAIAAAPDFAEAYANLAGALHAQGRLDEAIAAYREAYRLNGGLAEILVAICHLRQQSCDWEGLESAQREALDRAAEAQRRAPPFAVLCLTASPEEHLRAARRWAQGFAAIARNRLPPPGPARGPRLRIGYLSGDFNRHATASLIAELFERHDRARFEIFGYSCGADDGSPVRARLAAAFDRFVDLADLPHLSAAGRIRADAIDILVDLKGYTLHGRPEILALRPAPIQVSYLGFPGTMGAEFIDYLIADRFVVPPEQQPFYDEKLVYLPYCYQPNDTQRPLAASPPSRESCGLPADGFVFCCFNSSYKITSDMFDVWMRLLRDVPGSVLWLLDSNGVAADRLDHQALARGISPHRLVRAPRLPLADHLARLCLADLFLDTLPVNAHTTASEALWVGLPVLTCAGGAFVGRVAGSLLRAIGLPELVATSLADYEAAAKFLVARPALLASLRQRLIDNRHKAPLFDIARTIRDIEAAFSHMAERHAAGKPPEAFVVEDRRGVPAAA